MGAFLEEGTAGRANSVVSQRLCLEDILVLGLVLSGHHLEFLPFLNQGPHIFILHWAGPEYEPVCMAAKCRWWTLGKKSSSKLPRTVNI